MLTKQITLKNLKKNDSPKYVKIVNAFKESIESNALKKGESIPSINEFSKDYKVSRDTVYKAYTLLKEEGYIQATPNKGYYISQNTKKVLMLISTFKAYKEVFYHAFMECLPENVIVDLQFHHYSIKNFKSMLDVENGKYYKYIVMGFDHPEVERTLSKIHGDKLLLIDWKANLKLAENYVFQDFGKAFYSCLEGAIHLFKKYETLCFIYPEFTFHPYESVSYFENFCSSNKLNYTICTNVKELVVKKGTAYISVNDRILYELLNQSTNKDLIVGKDVGILSYNDTPLKRFTKKGISVISVDFKEFGTKVAEFITTDGSLRTYLKTHLIIRESL